MDDYAEEKTKFYNALKQAFFEAALRAHSKKLTSRASLELPALRAFDTYAKDTPTTLRHQDVAQGIEWEYLRQRAMYGRLEELQEHFALQGAAYHISEPSEEHKTHWDYRPSYGTWLPLRDSEYPALYAFPTMPAHTLYDFEHIIHVDKAVTIAIPKSEDVINIISANERLQAPIEILERDEVISKKSFFKTTTTTIKRRLERHPGFLYVDQPNKIDTEDIERLFKIHSVSAILIADRLAKQATLHTPYKLPRLHQELRSIAKPKPSMRAPEFHKVYKS